MRISRKAEYALRALVALARSSRPLQIGELSRVENIPVKFLEQILLNLRNTGFLASKRGVGGGYMLRLKAAEITVGEVIRALDGPVAPLPCAAMTSDDVPCSCPEPRTCPVRACMTELYTQMNAALDARSIEDLARRHGSHVLAFDI